MGRSIYCSTCKKEKEAGRDNESRCKSCKSEANKKRRAKKREDMGLPPLGSGRSIYCYKCGEVKENQKVGYCNKCHREKDNEWRLKTGRTEKHQTGLCPCGKSRIRQGTAYCRECRNAHSARWHREHPLQGEQLSRYKIRQATRYAIRRGYIIQKPCEVCGEIKVEAHHDDYNKPFDVRFLCQKHHLEHHINEGRYAKK